MSNSPEFFDWFLFVDSVVVFLIFVLEFVLGKRGREAILRSLELWSGRIKNTTFPGLISRDAATVLGWLVRVFGETWFSVRTILLSAVISLAITFAVLYVGIPALAGRQVHVFPVFTAFGPPNAFLDWLSLSVTMGLLASMAKSTSGIRLQAIIVFDMVLAVVFASLVWIVAIGAEAWKKDFTVVRTLIDATETMIEDVGTGEDLITSLVVLAVLFTSALPTLLHLGLSLVFLVSKLFRPVFLPVLLFLLERTLDTNYGPLTILAITLGGVAKLIQYWVITQAPVPFP